MRFSTAILIASALIGADAAAVPHARRAKNGASTGLEIAGVATLGGGLLAGPLGIPADITGGALLLAGAAAGKKGAAAGGATAAGASAAGANKAANGDKADKADKGDKGNKGDKDDA